MFILLNFLFHLPQLQDVTTPLDEYVFSDDGAYSFEELAAYSYDGVTVYIYNMTSQIWFDGNHEIYCFCISEISHLSFFPKFQLV